jgi:hypothetical protein
MMKSDYANFAEIPPAADTAEQSSVATAIADALTRARALYLKRLEMFTDADRAYLKLLKVAL